MAISNSELTSSREVSRFDDSITYTRRFKVWSDANDIVGSALPETVALAGSGVSMYSAHPSIVGYAATGYDVRKVQDADDLWEVDWHYSPLVTAPTVDIPITEPGYTELNISWTPLFIDVYRVQPSEKYQENILDPNGDEFIPDLIIPSDGNPDGTPDGPVDIEGMSVDERGVPTSKEHLTVTLRYTHVREVTDLSYFSTITSAVATRNDATWPVVGGASTGSLLYKGAQSTRIAPGVYRFVHEFVFDEWNHLRQVTRTNADDQIVKTKATNSNPTRYSGTVSMGVGSDASEVAAYVWWVQPFAEVSDFTDLEIP